MHLLVFAWFIPSLCILFQVSLCGLVVVPPFCIFFFFLAHRTPAPMSLNAAYINMKAQVIKAERRVLTELGFCVHVKHPHKASMSHVIFPSVCTLAFEPMCFWFMFQKMITPRVDISCVLLSLNKGSSFLHIYLHQVFSKSCHKISFPSPHFSGLPLELFSHPRGGQVPLLKYISLKMYIKARVGNLF